MCVQVPKFSYRWHLESAVGKLKLHVHKGDANGTGKISTGKV